MKRLFKYTYALLFIYFGVSTLTEASEHINGYIVIKTFYINPFQETFPEDNHIFQDVLMYQERTHHNSSISPPVFTETIKYMEYTDSAPLNTVLQLNDQIALSRGRVDINRCNDSPYLTISHDAKIRMRNIMNINNIPFNCNGFFMDNQQKIKIDIPDNQNVIGMFFSESRDSLYYLSFQQGEIYQLSERVSQKYFQDFNKKINSLFDSGELTVVGYKFSNIPLIEDIDPETLLYIPIHSTQKFYEKDKSIDIDTNPYYHLNNNFGSPSIIIQPNDFETLHNRLGRDDDDPEPFPIPIPGVGKSKDLAFGKIQ